MPTRLTSLEIAASPNLFCTDVHVNLGRLTNLSRLALQDLPISSCSLPANAVQLTRVALVGLQLTGLAIPAGLVSLQELSLSMNRLDRLPAGLSNAPALDGLWLTSQRCNLQVAQGQELQSLPNLRRVFMRQNAGHVWSVGSLLVLSRAEESMRLAGRRAHFSYLRTEMLLPSATIFR